MTAKQCATEDPGSDDSTGQRPAERAWKRNKPVREMKIIAGQPYRGHCDRRREERGQYVWAVDTLEIEVVSERQHQAAEKRELEEFKQTLQSKDQKDKRPSKPVEAAGAMV